MFQHPKNADKLGGLVEGIRNAMMDYQICMSHCSFLPYLMLALDIVATVYYKKSCQFIVSLTSQPFDPVD